MATPAYPPTLPGVSTFILLPTPQGIESDNEAGPQARRRRSRQPGAQAQVTFRFLESDYATFMSWWKTDLVYGHKWFTIDIPSAGGITEHFVRFADRPRAALQGHRHWELTTTIEIRDRQFAPVAPGDPFFDNVVLLLHLNGNLIDVKGHPFSTVGGSFVTDGPFGTQARDIGGDAPGGGGGNCLYATDPSTDWWMDDGDFSIEVTGRRDMTAFGRPREFIRLAETTTQRDYLRIGMSDATGPISLQVRTGLNSSESLNSTFNPAAGSWHRYHFRRIGNVHTLHVDETQVLEFTRTYRAPLAPIHVYLGNNTPGFVDGLRGRIKEVRITRGVARPIAAQTEPFPDA